MISTDCMIKIIPVFYVFICFGVFFYLKFEQTSTSSAFKGYWVSFFLFSEPNSFCGHRIICYSYSQQELSDLCTVLWCLVRFVTLKFDLLLHCQTH